MKRFHVHIAVDDLEANIHFYSAVFGVPPTVTKPDYAKWMIEEPRLNFAISDRGAKPGWTTWGFRSIRMRNWANAPEGGRGRNCRARSASVGMLLCAFG